jgi:hypothetical protein
LLVEAFLLVGERSILFTLILPFRTSTMLSRTVVSLSRRAAAAPAFAPSASRSVTTVAEAATADDALKFSGYQQIDFKIKDTASVYEAVQKLAAFNIGCLVTTDEAGTTPPGPLLHSTGECGMLSVLFDDGFPMRGSWMCATIALV